MTVSDRSSRVERFDAFQRRHPVVGFPIAVVYKFFDDQGSYLAALVTYYGFVSLFPLLLLLVTILGFVLHSNPQLQDQLVNGAFGQIPVLGDQLKSETRELRGSVIGVLVGVIGALYGGLGVAQAAQNAMNKVWAEEFGTAAQPNKPARAAFRTYALVLPGADLEIEFIAAKKVMPMKMKKK